MWLKILGLMMQQQDFCSPQSSLTMDTKAAVNSPTFPTTGTLANIKLQSTMRILFTTFLVLIFSLKCISQEKIKEAQILFQKPNEKWELKGKQNEKIIVLFRRFRRKNH